MKAFRLWMYSSAEGDFILVIKQAAPARMGGREPRQRQRRGGGGRERREKQHGDGGLVVVGEKRWRIRVGGRQGHRVSGRSRFRASSRRGRRRRCRRGGGCGCERWVAICDSQGIWTNTPKTRSLRLPSSCFRLVCKVREGSKGGKRCAWVRILVQKGAGRARRRDRRHRAHSLETPP
jgi:hypothetical protein